MAYDTLCRRRHRAAAANTALQTPSPRCSPPSRFFRADTTAAALPPPPKRFRALSLPPLRCHRCYRSVAAVPVLLPPLPLPCRSAARRRRAAAIASNAAAVLPLLPSRCQRHRYTARHRRAAATLPLPLCRCCHLASDAAAPLLPPSPCRRRRRCRPVTLLPRCLLPLSCCCRRHHRRFAAAAALALATPPPRCLPLPRRCCTASPALPILPLRCRR
jgi:hypothetical protein